MPEGPLDLPIRKFNFDYSKSIIDCSWMSRLLQIPFACVRSFRGSAPPREILRKAPSHLASYGIRTCTRDAARHPMVVAVSPLPLRRTASAAASRDSMTSPLPGVR